MGHPGKFATVDYEDASTLDAFPSERRALRGSRITGSRGLGFGRFRDWRCHG